MTWSWLDYWVGVIVGYFVWWWLSRGAVVKIAKDRDFWRDCTHRHEKLDESAQAQLNRWKALACNHYPNDPYRTLTEPELLQLLQERINEVHAQGAKAEEHD